VVGGGGGGVKTDDDDDDEGAAEEVVGGGGGGAWLVVEVGTTGVDVEDGVVEEDLGSMNSPAETAREVLVAAGASAVLPS
jgi:hypothetical protein